MGAAATDTERDRLVRRNTVLLAFAQGFVQTTFPVMLVIVLEAAGYGPLGVALAILVAVALILVARLRESVAVRP